MDTNFQFDAAHRFEHDAETHSSDAARTPHAGARGPSNEQHTVEFGSGWYHDAAIVSDKGTFAHPYR